MLDVRLVAYVCPLAEQPFESLTPVVRVSSFGDEPCTITGLVRIYRKSTGLLLYSSELAVTSLAGYASAEISALTPWDPPAPADDDFFILADILAVSTLHSDDFLRASLGAFVFDIKGVPMGEAPPAHHVTHEAGGSDWLVVTALPGLLADPQTPLAHAATHADGGGDDVNHNTLENLTTGDPHTQYQLETSVLTAAIASVTPQTLTDGAAIDWDLALGGAAQVTLGGDRTMNAPTNLVDGQRYRLKVIQDGTGTRLLTWNAVYRFPGGVDPCLSAAPGNIDILLFDCDGTHMDCVGMVNALA